MIFPAKFFDNVLGEETLSEKDKFIRFERLAELFTYIAVLAGVFLALLPYQFPFDRSGLFVFDAIVLVFSIIWFRFLPKKYSGRRKNFIKFLRLPEYFFGKNLNQIIENTNTIASNTNKPLRSKGN